MLQESESNITESPNTTSIQITGLGTPSSPLTSRIVVLSGALAAAAVIGAAVAGWHEAAVVGALGLAVVAAGLASLRRTQWTIGDAWVAHRGLFGSTRLEMSAVRAVMVPSDEVRQGDLLFLGSGLRAIALPADRLRRDRQLAASAAHLLDLAVEAGARVTEDAWRLVGRPCVVAAGPAGGTVVAVERRERRRSLSAA